MERDVELLTKPRGEVTQNDWAELKGWYFEVFGVKFHSNCMCNLETLRNSLKTKLGV